MSKDNIKKDPVLIRILKKIGIQFSMGGDRKICLLPNFYRVLIVFSVLLVAGSIGLLQYSTHPAFCKSCHIMKPYYDAWKTSTHNFVPCVDCHYPPGFRNKLKGKVQAISQVVKFVTRTYGTKPYAEIEDASCLQKGCHEKRLLKGKVVFMKGIIFDHKPHLQELRRGIQLKCTSCHSQIVIGTHIAADERVCFACHFKNMIEGEKISACATCHSTPKEDIKFGDITFNHSDFVGRGIRCKKCHLEVIEGKGEVVEERCFSCHGEPERLALIGDVEFMHRNHVTDHKVECYECHTTIKHSVKTDVEPLSYRCNICHTNKHTGSKQMYMGIGGKGVPSTPSPMFLAQVDCIGCHLVPEDKGPGVAFKGQTLEATDLGCLSCHGDGYRGIFAVWKEMVESSLAETGPKLLKAKEILDRSDKGYKNYRRAYKLYSDAKHNYDFVEYGRGVHNVDYADILLARARENSEEVISLLSER